MHTFTRNVRPGDVVTEIGTESTGPWYEVVRNASDVLTVRTLDGTATEVDIPYHPGQHVAVRSKPQPTPVEDWARERGGYGPTPYGRDWR